MGRQSTWDAMQRAKRNIKPPPVWSWQQSPTPGLYNLRKHGLTVGTVSLLPGAVAHEAVLLGEFVELINTNHS